MMVGIKQRDKNETKIRISYIFVARISLNESRISYDIDTIK